MAQPVKEFTPQELEAIGRETVQQATHFTPLLEAVKRQLCKRGVVFAQLDEQTWGVLHKTPPRRARQFTSVDDAITHAFELYDAQGKVQHE